MNRRTFILVSLPILSGCTSTGNNSAPNRSTNTDTEPLALSEEILEVERGDNINHTYSDILQVRDFGWTDRELDFGTPGAAGVVKNITNTRLAEVSLAVDFYDGDTQIGSNMSWINFLDSGEYGTLEVPYTGENPNRVTRVQFSASIQEAPILPVNDGHVSVSDDGVGENEHGWPSVTGTLVNDTTERLERVVVHVNFYRGQEFLAQSRDSTSRLGAGGRAEWSASTNRAESKDITRYETIVTVRE